MASKPSEKKAKARAPNRRGSGRGGETKVSPKKPNYVDEHVAKRLRLRRNLLGLSQDELARRLNLTPQLIQKYETAETRISASRLYDIAAQLETDMLQRHPDWLQPEFIGLGARCFHAAI